MWQRAVVGTFGPDLTTRGSDATLEHRVAHAAGRSFNAPPRPAAVLTPRLADAVRNLDEGAKVLAQVRRTGT